MSKGIWWISDNITKIPENAWKKLLQSAAAHYSLIFTAVIKEPFLTYWKPYFFFFNYFYCTQVTFALFLNSAAARGVLGIQTSGGFWRLKLPEGITDLLLHSSSLPLLTVIFCSKKEKQGRKREA